MDNNVRIHFHFMFQLIQKYKKSRTENGPGPAFTKISRVCRAKIFKFWNSFISSKILNSHLLLLFPLMQLLAVLTGFLLWRQYWRHFWGSFFYGGIVGIQSVIESRRSNRVSKVFGARVRIIKKR
jgi:hypothetical protein